MFHKYNADGTEADLSMYQAAIHWKHLVFPDNYEELKQF
jgi:hypothetical protein